ncbi:MAG: bifunctional riboflavin kinase/FAD synthetase [Robiginitalea sp.]|uniref:bifunctional riboflavin kinase/FAD synthetase n=1 Tax=Robiginitalea sp. TaxID=1902411 RepID=UPI003C753504
MLTVKGLSHYDNPSPSVVTIGTFDGVHIGHRKILEKVISEGHATGLQSTLLTFFPHPRMVLQKDNSIKLLNTIEEKSEILRAMGLDMLVVHPFTKNFSRLSATEFVRDMLVEKLRVKKVIIGYDHRFGRNRNANINDLRSFGNLFDFEVAEIPAQEIDAVSVSSTKIRKALEVGDLETATAYLGYPYMLSGTVQKGIGLGRQLGFPTANLSITASYKLIPAGGVYVVQARFGDQMLFGMMNIGTNPTVDGSKQHIEVHLFDFEKDLYGQTLQVELLYRIRDERKFDSVEALKIQLGQDQQRARSLIQRS